MFHRLMCTLVFAAIVLSEGLVYGQFFPGRGPARTDLRGTVKTIDANAGTITVATGDGRQSANEKSYYLAKDVEVALSDGGTRRALFLFKEGKLSDLVTGTIVNLTLSADQTKVDSILAEGPSLRGVLKGVNIDQKTLTVTVPMQRDQEPEERTLAIASGAEVVVDDGRGRRLSLKEAKLSDLVPGTFLQLALSVDQKQVLSVQAEGPSLQGTVQSLNPDKNEITLTMFPRRGGEEPAERTVVLAEDALVLLDDGRGRRLSIKEGKLSEIPIGSSASVRLTADQKRATVVRAEGPVLQALIRAIDPNAGTVTIAQRAGRGENPEEKQLSLAKDVRVVIQGNEAKLTDVKIADNGPFAMLRLSLDQKSVQSLFVSQPR
jgi:hypothetical protein